MQRGVQGESGIVCRREYYCIQKGKTNTLN